MSREERGMQVRNMLANYAIFENYQKVWELVERHGCEGAIHVLEWQLACVRDIQNCSENSDEELA